MATPKNLGRVSCLLAGGLLLFAFSTATADEDVIAQSTALYNEGQFDAAIALLTGARQQTTDPGRLAKINLLLGLNHAVLGEMNKTRAAFREALRYDPELKLDPAVVKASLIELFEAEKAQLRGTLEVAAARALEVVIDGKPCGKTPLSVELPIGSHQVEVKSESGEVVHRRKILLRPGSTERLQVVLPALPAAPKPRAAPKPHAAPKHRVSKPPVVHRHKRRRIWTWVVAGVAVAEAAVGFGLWGWGSAGYDEFQTTESPERYDELKESLPDRYLAADIMLGLAAGTAAAAIVLYFVEGRGAPEHRTTRVSPSPGGLTLQF